MRPKKLLRWLGLNFQLHGYLVLWVLPGVIVFRFTGSLHFLLTLAGILFFLEQYFLIEIQESCRKFKLGLMANSLELFLVDLVWCLTPVLVLGASHLPPLDLLFSSATQFEANTILGLISLTVLLVCLFNAFSIKSTLYLSVGMSLLTFANHFGFFPWLLILTPAPILLILFIVFLVLGTGLYLHSRRGADRSSQYFI